MDRPEHAVRMPQYARVYLAKKRADIERASGKEAKHLNQGGLFRDLGNPEMSLKTFLKALRVLPIVKIKASIEITWESQKVTLHAVEAQISHEDEDDDFMGEETDKPA